LPAGESGAAGCEPGSRSPIKYKLKKMPKIETQKGVDKLGVDPVAQKKMLKKLQ
jgi:hypothetical protein